MSTRYLFLSEACLRNEVEGRHLSLNDICFFSTSIGSNSCRGIVLLFVRRSFARVQLRSQPLDIRLCIFSRLI